MKVNYRCRSALHVHWTSRTSFNPIFRIPNHTFSLKLCDLWMIHVTQLQSTVGKNVHQPPLESFYCLGTYKLHLEDGYLYVIQTLTNFVGKVNYQI